jgi:hypothetical protein
VRRGRIVASHFVPTFLQLFLVVVGSCFFDLRLDLADAACNVGLFASTVNNGGVFPCRCGRTWHGTAFHLTNKFKCSYFVRFCRFGIFDPL